MGKLVDMVDTQSIISSRMVNCWSRIVTGSHSKYTYRMYSLVRSLHENNSFYTSPWVGKIMEIFNNCGMGNIWLAQDNHNTIWLNHSIKLRLSDIDFQNWCSEVFENSLCKNYRIFKNELKFEHYLCSLEFSDRILLSKFRCCNTRIPNNTNRFSNDHTERNCNLCNENLTGDEFHYLFECKYFKDERLRYLDRYFTLNPNCPKMHMLFNTNDVPSLTKLCKFIRIITAKYT